MINVPSFAFSSPAQQVAPPVQQQQQQVQAPMGFAPEQDLMSLSTCADFESGKPPLPIGEYDVLVTRVHRPITRKKGKPFICEYTVEKSNNDVEPGRQASYFRTLISDEDASYLSQWLCTMLGARTKEERLQVKKLQPFIVHAELTEQPVAVFDAVTRQPVLGADGKQVMVPPGLLVGQRFHLSVIPGSKESKRQPGKIYDEQVWTRLPAQQ